MFQVDFWVTEISLNSTMQTSNLRPNESNTSCDAYGECPKMSIQYQPYTLLKLAEESQKCDNPSWIAWTDPLAASSHL